MKKLAYFLLTISFLFSFGIKSQNLIDNSGFETWSNAQPTSWSTSGGAIALSKNTSNFHDGTSSCQVDFTSDENQNLISNSFAVTPGDSIYVSFYGYDNDPAGRARISVLYEGSINVYGDYTEDMDSWQMVTYNDIVPEGATMATFQIRFYDVAANWDGSGQILIDQTSFVPVKEIEPEPSNYPTEFQSIREGVSANLTWIDATGDQLPHYYLILASKNNLFSTPVDGTMVANDEDISDGSGAINIPFGQQFASFSGLDAGNYYFVIYPYSNTGVDVNYKTDETVPSTSVQVPEVTVLTFVNFQDDSFGDWVPLSILGDQIWQVEEFSRNKFAAMNGYSGGAQDNEDWIISPSINTTQFRDVLFSFSNALNFTGPAIQVFLSNDYNGNGNPAAATWIDITSAFNYSEGAYNWVQSGSLNLDEYQTTSLYLAFKYTSSISENAAKWELDNFLVTGLPYNYISEISKAKFLIFPNPGSGQYRIENELSEKLTISIFNVTGQKILNLISSEKSIEINLNDSGKGTYWVQIITDNIIKTLPVINE